MTLFPPFTICITASSYRHSRVVLQLYTSNDAKRCCPRFYHAWATDVGTMSYSQHSERRYPKIQERGRKEDTQHIAQFKLEVVTHTRALLTTQEERQEEQRRLQTIQYNPTLYPRHPSSTFEGSIAYHIKSLRSIQHVSRAAVLARNIIFICIWLVLITSRHNYSPIIWEASSLRPSYFFLQGFVIFNVLQ